MKENVIIFGSSGHTKVVIDIFEQEGKYNILGLLDSFREKGEKFQGYETLGHEKDLPELVSQHHGLKLFIAVGDNWGRNEVKNKIAGILPDIEYASAIHPSAQIGKNVTIGKGVVIMPGGIVNCDSKIGDFTIINTNASVDHDCILHDYSSLAPNATAGGNVSVGYCSAISIGATIKHKVNVGDHSIVGAGALLMKDCGNNVIMYGVPARVIRKREIGEKYL